MSGGHFVRTYEHWALSTSLSEYGEPIEEWTKQADISGRAYKASITGRFGAGREYGLLSWTFACNPDASITNGDQIRFDGRTLEIKAVSVTSRGDRLEALCEEIQ